jgi:hypothetical protein
MNWTNFIDNLQKVFSIGAVCGGAFWIYFNYFRGRTFHSRLQLEMSASIVPRDGRNYILVTMQLKNIGLSRIDFARDDCGVRVSSLATYQQASELLSPVWKDETAFPVLASFEWVEPGVTLKEQQLIVAPAQECDAFELELSVYSQGTFWAKSTSWSTFAIALTEERKQAKAKQD